MVVVEEEYIHVYIPGLYFNVIRALRNNVLYTFKFWSCRGFHVCMEEHAITKVFWRYAHTSACMESVTAGTSAKQDMFQKPLSTGHFFPASHVVCTDIHTSGSSSAKGVTVLQKQLGPSVPPRRYSTPGNILNSSIHNVECYCTEYILLYTIRTRAQRAIYSLSM